MKTHGRQNIINHHTSSLRVRYTGFATGAHQVRYRFATSRVVKGVRYERTAGSLRDSLRVYTKLATASLRGSQGSHLALSRARP